MVLAHQEVAQVVLARELVELELAVLVRELVVPEPAVLVAELAEEPGVEVGVNSSIHSITLVY